MAKDRLNAVCFSLALLIVSPVRADDGVSQEEPLTEAVTSLASEVERTVALTKPFAWEMKHACLYYGFAGNVCSRAKALRLHYGSAQLSTFPGQPPPTGSAHTPGWKRRLTSSTSPPCRAGAR